jgi:tRNA threonylcarbamoyl adenosine modification protein YeaZ
LAGAYARLVLLLAIDTATPAVTVALRTGEVVLAESSTVDARRHGELLAPAIRQVLQAAGVLPSGLTAVVVGLGPGPYTGLRVGVVTAAALSHSLGAPAYGACSLDVIAADAEPGEGFVVATDARRREVYWAAYDGSGNRVDGPRVDRPADVPVGGRRVEGPAVDLYAEAMGWRSGGVRYPRAATLGRLVAARAAAGRPADELRPLYLRRPDAVERAAVTPA